MNLLYVWIALLLLHSAVVIELARLWERFSQDEKSATQRLTVLMRKYPHRAHAWHDAIAQAFVAQGGTPSVANQAAVRVMASLLDVDTRAHAKDCAAVRVATGGRSSTSLLASQLAGVASVAPVVSVSKEGN